MFVLNEESSSMIINPPDERLSVGNCQISKRRGKKSVLVTILEREIKKLNRVRIDYFQAFIQQFSNIEVLV